MYDNFSQAVLNIIHLEALHWVAERFWYDKFQRLGTMLVSEKSNGGTKNEYIMSFLSLP